MKTKVAVLIRLIMVWPLTFLSVILICGAPLAHSSINKVKLINLYSVTNRSSDVPAILSVLESRIKNRKLLQKAEAKLRTLSQLEIHLISTLCQRISNEKDSAGVDIALSLVMALIALS